MHKISLAVLLASACFAFAAIAGTTDSAQTPEKTAPTTVSAAQNLPDNTAVVLQGTIVPATDSAIYVFTDSTGSINAEIDADDLNGLNIGPNDIVLIQGEVDRNGDIAEIDVEDISLAQ